MNGNQNIQNTKLPSVAFLLRESFGIYKKYFWNLVSIAVFMLVPPIFGFLSDNLIYQIILGLVGVIISFLVLIALIYAINNFVNGQIIRTSDSFRIALSLVLAFVWLNIIGLFIIIGAFFLLIIPMIIISVLFVFAEYNLVVENQRGLNALLRSRHLVKGNWWGVLWKLLTFVLLIWIPVFILIFGLLAYLTDFPQLMDLISTILIILVTPLAVAYVYQLFRSLIQKRPLETFNPQEERKFYKGMIIWGIIALSILIALLIILLFISLFMVL